MKGIIRLPYVFGQVMRFSFGSNWRSFLAVLDEARIARARQSLEALPIRDHLHGKTFLDVGSGSGLFSLAARSLGAHVHSFDLDPESVECTKALRARFFPGDTNWLVETGSALDEQYLSGLGAFDIVYSWGVLHHTGAMWQALESASRLLKPQGWLVVAIYNDQGRASRRWLHIKRLYNWLPPSLRWCVVIPALIRLWGPTILRDLVRGRPLESWRRYGRERGMSPWHDVVDWVGGWPFEVAKPETVFAFFRSRGFTLEYLVTCAGGIGCNEFVFRRIAN